MPNIVNEMLYRELEQSVRDAGSCLVVSFDKLTVEQVSDLRNKFRESGLEYRVVKNRLATRAFRSVLDIDMSRAFQGKCGIVIAPEEDAISAAKMIREAVRRQKQPALIVTGAVIEGEAITGPAATTIADMADRETVRAQIATAISGPARNLACVVSAVAGGLARVIQARIDKEGGAG